MAGRPLEGVNAAVYGAVWPAKHGSKDGAVARLQNLGATLAATVSAATHVIATAASARALASRRRQGVVVGWPWVKACVKAGGAVDVSPYLLVPRRASVPAASPRSPPGWQASSAFMAKQCVVLVGVVLPSREVVSSKLRRAGCVLVDKLPAAPVYDGRRVVAVACDSLRRGLTLKHARDRGIPIVTMDWVNACLSAREVVDVSRHLVALSPSAKSPTRRTPLPVSPSAARTPPPPSPARPLRGVAVVLVGVFGGGSTTGATARKQAVGRLARAGASVRERVSADVVVVATARAVASMHPKITQAVAAGVPIVSWEWVTESLAAGVPVDTAPYTMSPGGSSTPDTVPSPATTSGRNSLAPSRRRRLRPLTGYGLVVVSADAAARDDCMAVAAAAGATVRADVTGDTSNVVAVVVGDVSDAMLAPARSAGVPIVHQEWLQASLDAGDVMDTGPYRVSPPSGTLPLDLPSMSAVAAALEATAPEPPAAPPSPAASQPHNVPRPHPRPRASRPLSGFTVVPVGDFRGMEGAGTSRDVEHKLRLAGATATSQLQQRPRGGQPTVVMVSDSAFQRGLPIVKRALGWKVPVVSWQWFADAMASGVASKQYLAYLPLARSPVARSGLGSSPSSRSSDPRSPLSLRGGTKLTPRQRPLAAPRRPSLGAASTGSTSSARRRASERPPAQIFPKCRIVVTGNFPQAVGSKDRVAHVLRGAGATVTNQLNQYTTCVVCGTPTGKDVLNLLKRAAAREVPAVSWAWVEASTSAGRRLPFDEYLVRAPSAVAVASPTRRAVRRAVPRRLSERRESRVSMHSPVDSRTAQPATGDEDDDFIRRVVVTPTSSDAALSGLAPTQAPLPPTLSPRGDLSPRGTPPGTPPLPCVAELSPRGADSPPLPPAAVSPPAVSPPEAPAPQPAATRVLPSPAPPAANPDDGGLARRGSRIVVPVESQPAGGILSGYTVVLVGGLAHVGPRGDLVSVLVGLGAHVRDLVSTGGSNVVVVTSADTVRGGGSSQIKKARLLGVPVVAWTWVSACQAAKSVVSVGSHLLATRRPSKGSTSPSPVDGGLRGSSVSSTSLASAEPPTLPPTPASGLRIASVCLTGTSADRVVAALGTSGTHVLAVQGVPGECDVDTFCDRIAAGMGPSWRFAYSRNMYKGATLGAATTTVPDGSNHALFWNESKVHLRPGHVPAAVDALKGSGGNRQACLDAGLQCDAEFQVLPGVESACCFVHAPLCAVFDVGGKPFAVVSVSMSPSMRHQVVEIDNLRRFVAGALTVAVVGVWAQREALHYSTDVPSLEASSFSDATGLSAATTAKGTDTAFAVGVAVTTGRSVPVDGSRSSTVWDVEWA